VDFGGDLEKKFYFCTNCELKVVIVVLITVKSGVTCNLSFSIHENLL
jgi:hypothetical protein